MSAQVHVFCGRAFIQGGGVLCFILGFYVTPSLYKPLSVNKTGGAYLA